MTSKEEKWKRRMMLREERGDPPPAFWKRWFEILLKVILPKKKD